MEKERRKENPEPVLLWELSVSFNIFHRHRVCLVAVVDLICSLYSWWEGFWSSSVAMLPLEFDCGFIPTCMWITHRSCSWGRAGGLRSALVRTGLELAQLMGLQGSWKQQVCRGAGGHRNRKCGALRLFSSSGCSAPVKMVRGSRGPWKQQVCRGAGGHGHRWYGTIRIFFWPGCSAPERIGHVGGAAAWIVGTLAAPSVQRHWYL